MVLRQRRTAMMPKLSKRWEDIVEYGADAAREIKPIETEYNGYKFRSRLEARWAVFFDAAGIEYEYEPDGYQGCDGIKYLPDFKLRDGVFVEVKGSDEMLERDFKKLSAAIDFRATPVSDGLLVLGQIPNPDEVSWDSLPIFSYLWHREGVVCDYAAFTGRKRKPIAYGMDAITKSMLTIGTKYDVDYTAYWNPKPAAVTTKTRLMTLDGIKSDATERLRDAYKKARQARFEFGETPKAN